MKRSRLLAAVAVALVLAALLYYLYGGGTAPRGQIPLVSLNPSNFDRLRREFNEARGAVRVITLLSPT
jgi:hypothetical protein